MASAAIERTRLQNELDRLSRQLRLDHARLSQMADERSTCGRCAIVVNKNNREGEGRRHAAQTPLLDKPTSERTEAELGAFAAVSTGPSTAASFTPGWAAA